MANKGDARPARRFKFEGLWRLGVVAVVAVVAFIAGLSRFPDARFLACTMTARTDPSYSARVFLPPVMSPISRRLFLSRQSQGVTVRIAINAEQGVSSRARVCIDAYPTNKTWLGVSDEAHQVGPGQYEVLLGFDPPGPWSARVVVVAPNREPVAIPVSFTTPFPAPPTTQTSVP